MLYYFIPLVIIIVSLLIIIFIIIKKFPSLSVINVESIAQEKESRVKNKILIERLGRFLLDFKKWLAEVFKPVFKGLSSAGSKTYQKIIELEKKDFKKQPLKKIDASQKVKNKIEVAKKYLSDQDFIKAEEICISILELDDKNWEAYEILAETYRERKEYKKAKETCRYLIKLLNKNKTGLDKNGAKYRLANCYADLGLIYQLKNKNNQALTNFQKAVKLEPNNPRFLDLLLKICIILKNKKLALKTFSALKKADPENQKLAELKDEINTINH